MQKNSGNKMLNESSRINTTKAVLDMFPVSYKFSLVIRVAVILVGGVFLLHFGGADLKGILISLPLSMVLLGMAIIGGLRCIKNVLTDKERKDLEDLQDWKIFQAMKNPLSSDPGKNSFLNFIVIMSNIIRWVFFLIFLFSISCLVILHNNTSRTIAQSGTDLGGGVLVLAAIMAGVIIATKIMNAMTSAGAKQAAVAPIGVPEKPVAGGIGQTGLGAGVEMRSAVLPPTKVFEASPVRSTIDEALAPQVTGVDRKVIGAIAKEFSVASSGILRRGQTVEVDLGTAGTYKVERKMSGAIYINNREKVNLAISNDDATLLDILKTRIDKGIADNIQKYLRDNYGVETLHYEVSATVYNNANTKPTISKVAKITVNPDTGAVTQMESEKNELTGKELVAAGGIAWSGHFGHTRVSSPEEFDNRTMGDKLAMLMRYEDTGLWVPETIVTKEGASAFSARTIGGDQDPKALAVSLRGFLQTKGQGAVAGVIRSALNRLTASQIVAIDKTPDDGLRAALFAHTEFLNAYTIARLRLLEATAAGNELSIVIFANSRNGFDLESMRGSIKALARSRAINIVVAIPPGKDIAGIENVQFVQTYAANIEDICRDIKGPSGRAVKPSDIAVGLTGDDTQALRAYAAHAASVSDNSKICSLLIANRDALTQDKKDRLNGAVTKIPALTILQLLARIATAARGDKPIATAVGYKNPDTLESIFGTIFRFLAIKSEDIGRAVADFVRGYTETGRAA